LSFSDEVSNDPSGPLRILWLQDGFYVVGEGMCLPAATRQRAELFIAGYEAASLASRQYPHR